MIRFKLLQPEDGWLTSNAVYEEKKDDNLLVNQLKEKDEA